MISLILFNNKSSKLHVIRAVTVNEEEGVKVRDCGKRVCVKMRYYRVTVYGLKCYCGERGLSMWFYILVVLAILIVNFNIIFSSSFRSLTIYYYC